MIIQSVSVIFPSHLLASPIGQLRAVGSPHVRGGSTARYCDK